MQELGRTLAAEANDWSVVPSDVGGVRVPCGVPSAERGYLMLKQYLVFSAALGCGDGGCR